MRALPNIAARVSCRTNVTDPTGMTGVLPRVNRLVVLVVLVFIASAFSGLGAGVGEAYAQGAGIMAPQGVLQEGWAYVYAPEHQGRRTASGDTFQHEALTGAHRTLPLGSVVRVTNLESGKVATVRINDRGPYIATRIIDLSLAAARQIGMTRGGTRVRLELTNGALPADAEAAMRFDETARPNRDRTAEAGTGGDAGSGRTRPLEYTIQLGSFSDEEAASRLARSVEGGWLYRIRVGETDFYRVNFGIYASSSEAESALASLQTHGVRGFVKTVEDAERRAVIEQ